MKDSPTVVQSFSVVSDFVTLWTAPRLGFFLFFTISRGLLERGQLQAHCPLFCPSLSELTIHSFAFYFYKHHLSPYKCQTVAPLLMIRS